jgi:glycosyltransferase involved in cell wall biosynthesis
VPNKRIAYVVNHVAFFVSHRLPLAIGARHSGFGVRLFTGQAGSQEMELVAQVQLKAAEVEHQRAIFSSAGMNPLVELLGVLQLVYFMLWYKPDVVHCASPKGVLYGGIAARLCGVRGLVLAISGMGYAYTQGTGQGGARVFVRWVYDALAGFAFHHPNVHVIVQNQDDYQSFIENGLVDAGRVTLVPGSGVDLSLFEGCNPARKVPMVLLPARMLKDKGIIEFVDAARQLKAVAPEWRFVLAGAAGYDNPSAISLEQLQAWQTEGCVEWLGHVDDMTQLFREAAIVCLPSYYREGMPKALLEAAAAGCAVVTTDMPGCREAVVPGVTGDLVQARDSGSLVKALLSLIKDEQRQRSYGAKGQERAKAIFSVASVISQTLNIYDRVLRHD